jgi:sucrose 6(F)-phosphate phosphorylase
LKRGANLSLILSPAHKDPDGFDVHQIRGTYYSLLDCDDAAYLAARAIQFFTPGIPQVYYVGLLAGRNDIDAVKLTGEGRELNRHNYSLSEIESEIQRPVVGKLIELIKFRNSHPAFNGTFDVEASNDSEIVMSWIYNENYARLHIDLTDYSVEIVCDDASGNQIMKKIA